MDARESWEASRPLIIDSLDRLEKSHARLEGDLKESREISAKEHKEMRGDMARLDKAVSLVEQKLLIWGGAALVLVTVFGPMIRGAFEHAIGKP